jgi:chromosome segregation ATPase
MPFRTHRVKAGGEGTPRDGLDFVRDCWTHGPALPKLRRVSVKRSGLERQMADLESSLKALQTALDSLEERLAERLGDLAHGADAVDAARRQAKIAKRLTAEAADDLSLAIEDLNSILRAGVGNPDR